MSRLARSDLYRILSQISDQNFEPEHIFGVFKKELPFFVDRYGILLLKATIYEPIRRSIKMKITDIELYGNDVEDDSNRIEMEFQITNGGKVVVTTILKPGYVWTTEAKEDNYVMSRLIFLLVGRAKTMAVLKSIMFTDRLTGIAMRLVLVSS